MVGVSSRGTHRLMSKQKAVMAPHLTLLQATIRKSSEFTKGDLVPMAAKESALPNHRDDILEFLRTYKDSGALTYSSPLGALLSQQSTSAESQKINDKSAQLQPAYRKLLRPDESVYLECYGRE